jgi:ribosomal protein S18 acetylase RimI-like enzyme
VRRAIAEVDEPLLHRLNMESFADHWGFTPSPYGDWLHWLRAMGVADPDLWLVAETRGEAAGLVLCRPADHGDPDCGWVSVLGVLPAHRHRGVGSALLRQAFVELAGRGRRRVALGVDADNTTGAVGLYERAGMQVVERSDSWELRG